MKCGNARFIPARGRGMLPAMDQRFVAPRVLTAADCGALEPRMFAVDCGSGERLAGEVARLLDPVAADSLHYWSLAAAQSTELHFHDHDEHWLWTAGRTMITIRLPDGRSERFGIGPGWIVYCVRGVEHGHQPLEDWACYECVGLLRDGARTGHRHRTL